MSKTADALSGSSQYMNSIIAKTSSVLGSSSYGVPLITYGLIGLTTVILAYVTLIENGEAAAPVSSPVSPSESSILSNPFSSPEPEPESSSTFGGSKSKRKHKRKKSKTKRRV